MRRRGALDNQGVGLPGRDGPLQPFIVSDYAAVQLHRTGHLLHLRDCCVTRGLDCGTKPPFAAIARLSAVRQGTHYTPLHRKLALRCYSLLTALAFIQSKTAADDFTHDLGGSCVYPADPCIAVKARNFVFIHVPSATVQLEAFIHDPCFNF